MAIEMSDEEGEKVSLVWLPGLKGITGNEMADIEAKHNWEHIHYNTNHKISNGRRATTKWKKEKANQIGPNTEKDWEERTKPLSPR
jgi:hypothetical protein